jgi:hypothetical protein
VLDHGEVVELDGGTLVFDGEESPSVLLRLTPWRARSVARVLQEWSSVSRIFHYPARLHWDELDLSRTLELVAAALGDHDEPIMRSPRGSRVILNRQRLAAVAVLGQRAAQLSAVQRPALVDAAAWCAVGLGKMGQWVQLCGSFLDRRGGHGETDQDCYCGRWLREESRPARLR